MSQPSVATSPPAEAAPASPAVTSPQHSPMASPMRAAEPSSSPQAAQTPSAQGPQPLQLPSPGAPSPGRSLPSSPGAAMSPRSGDNRTPIRQNHVSTTLLHGIPIVSLLIDGKERLCLAQISNTLLKPYSYNEIHNRRVALGITCVQCTPVQLEILRRAGAMPISSRRCGMITKREAERLVKSFLDETAPPKLPENFAFDVKHECGWGSRGSFIPSRYNSSRAKCIKCSYCNMYFSPNKFIFHYHRAPDSKYHHPDAANFNSWRRHLTLNDARPSDDLLYAWEDVKAMFNGGTRKRILSAITSKTFSSTTNTHSRNNQPEMKRPKFDLHDSVRPPPRMPPPPAPLQYPMFPMNNKMLHSPMKTMPGHPVFGLPHCAMDKPIRAPMNSHMKPPEVSIPNMHETLYPPYEMIWAKHLGLTNTESSLVPSPGNRPFIKQTPAPSVTFPSQISPGKPPTDFSAKALIEGPDPKPMPDSMSGLSGKSDHASAFKPVGGRKVELPESENKMCNEEENFAISRESATNSRENTFMEEEEEDESDCENVDVDTIEDDDGEALEQNNNNNKNSASPDQLNVTHSPSMFPESSLPECDSDEDKESEKDSEMADDERHSYTQCSEEQQEVQEQEDWGEEDRTSPQLDTDNNKSSPSPQQSQTPPKDGVYRDFSSLSKEQLQEELLIEIQVRKKIEEDCRTIKETFREQVDREKQYRDEMTRQLQIVRESLCQELDQERKARFTLQQKLKEAHDALHNFSCKMLASRQCAECAYKEPVLPR